MLGRQTVARAHAADGAGVDCFARRHIAHEIQRAAEFDVALLAGLQTVVHRAECLPGGTAVAAQRRQPVRLQRKAVVGAAAVSVERKVFFDNAGAQRHGGNGGGVVQRMVGQAGR